MCSVNYTLYWVFNFRKRNPAYRNRSILKDYFTFLGVYFISFQKNLLFFPSSFFHNQEILLCIQKDIPLMHKKHLLMDYLCIYLDYSRFLVVVRNVHAEVPNWNFREKKSLFLNYLTRCDNETRFFWWHHVLTVLNSSIYLLFHG